MCYHHCYNIQHYNNHNKSIKDPMCTYFKKLVNYYLRIFGVYFQVKHTESYLDLNLL